MNKSTCWMSVLVFCSAIAVGCGDDDDSGNKASDGGPDGGAHTDGGSAADAATGSGGRSSPSGTGGSTTTAMAIKCGSAMCMASPLGALGGTPCCADEKAGTCGMMMGSSCNPPPKVDPGCPMITIPVVGMMGSCCAKNGMCGLDGSALGMGCVDYKMVTSSLGILGGVITLPPAQRCGDASDDGGTTHGDEDAGQ